MGKLGSGDSRKIEYKGLKWRGRICGLITQGDPVVQSNSVDLLASTSSCASKRLLSRSAVKCHLSNPERASCMGDVNAGAAIAGCLLQGHELGELSVRVRLCVSTWAEMKRVANGAGRREKLDAEALRWAAVALTLQGPPRLHASLALQVMSRRRRCSMACWRMAASPTMMLLS